jgi:hypothetical protein
MSADRFSPADFGLAFQRFLEWIERSEDGRSAPFETLLAEHFAADPSEYPVTAEALDVVDLPNLQLALDVLLDRKEVEHRVSGFAGPVEHVDLSLSGLVHDETFGIRKGPIRRHVIELDEGRSLSCVTTGLFLLRLDETPVALLVVQSESGFGRARIRLEVMAARKETGEGVLADLRTLMSERNVYRGRVLTLDGSGDYGEDDVAIQFRAVPEVPREEIILPEGVLEVIELHTVEFSEHAEKLLAGGRHLRRGLLLHGPPGTGKTLTVMHLIGRLPGRTVIILSGNGLSLIGEACALARDLAPSMVVLEDVDLVAQDRGMDGPTSLLFELMNQIDGIGHDADVIFLMTTNRADVLEPALAARPGRVDQAIAIPLPDRDARRDLLDLYCRGLDVRLRDADPVLEMTEGVSAAFIRELVRKAALCAAKDGSDHVEDEHFGASLALLERGGSITRTMLGGNGGRELEGLDDECWDDDE